MLKLVLGAFEQCVRLDQYLHVIDGKNSIAALGVTSNDSLLMTFDKDLFTKTQYHSVMDLAVCEFGSYNSY